MVEDQVCKQEQKNVIEKQRTLYGTMLQVHETTLAVACITRMLRNMVLPFDNLSRKSLIPDESYGTAFPVVLFIML